MDLRETYEDHEESMRSMWAGIQKHLMTALVCIVAEDSDGHTVKLQPAIKRTIDDQTYDQTTYEDFPLLHDVPVHFSGGGGTTYTHPIKKGDEILAIFTSRPHDTWFQSGGTQQQIFNRMHSLADAIAIPGIRSTPRKLNPPPSTTSAQLRSDDGNHFVDLHPQNGITHKSSVSVTLDAPSHTIKGELTVQPDDQGRGGNLTVKAINGNGGKFVAETSAESPVGLDALAV